MRESECLRAPQCELARARAFLRLRAKVLAPPRGSAHIYRATLGASARLGRALAPCTLSHAFARAERAEKRRGFAVLQTVLGI